MFVKFMRFLVEAGRYDLGLYSFVGRLSGGLNPEGMHDQTRRYKGQLSEYLPLCWIEEIT